MFGRFARWALLLSACANASAAAEGDDVRVERFVRQWASHGASVLGRTDYSTAFVDLNGDSADEALVYLAGPDWCGSGGCNLLVLKRAGNAFRLVTNVTVSRPPIRVFPHRSHGWRDIGVFVAGGGIPEGHEAVLRFDGKSYPSNPTRAATSPASARGETLLTSDSPKRRFD